MKIKMSKHLEQLVSGRLDRRQLIQTLGFTAAAALTTCVWPKSLSAFAGSAARDAAMGTRVFPVKTVNHLSLVVADYARSRDWYVDLFGMRVVWDDGKGAALEFGDLKSPNGMYIRNVSKPGDIATVNHIAYGLPDFMTYKLPMKAELERRRLKNIRPDGEVGWICDDPAGYMLNIVPVKDPAMYPGAAKPCEVAKSAECEQGWESGLKNLNMAPKPSGKGFKAIAYSHILLSVPIDEITKEKEFYRDMFAMKVFYDVGGDNPQVFMRFGQNTLYIRKTAKPGDKPYCNHFAFVVEDFNNAMVETELNRRGLNPKPDSKLGWTIADPDGFRLEVGAWGLPEHIANDCKGINATCPGGIRG
jgi:catechol 2,3-dioxygenase-like lactoylglutathione lyase family enzyme